LGGSTQAQTSFVVVAAWNIHSDICIAASRELGFLILPVMSVCGKEAQTCNASHVCALYACNASHVCALYACNAERTWSRAHLKIKVLPCNTLLSA
jgi:hypothetical protein